MSSTGRAGTITGLFPPAKRLGILLHGALVTVLACVSGWGFWQMSSAAPGPAFISFLLLGSVAFAPIPLLGYRAFALQRAQYLLDRDTLELAWGLRKERIPLADIEWIRPIEDLSNPLVPPGLPLPGAVLGLRRHRDLGVVEFLCSGVRGILLVSTPRRVYAISPARPKQFLDTFARAVELGSLRDAEAESQYPSFVLSRAWASGWVRYLWLVTLFMNLGLTTWVSLLIPTAAQFAIGYRPDRPPDLIYSVQLTVVPLLSGLLSLISWALGLYFFGREDRRPIAVVVWTGGALVGLLFMLATLFIANTPV